MSRLLLNKDVGKRSTWVWGRDEPTGGDVHETKRTNTPDFT